jgi:histidinol-phosphate aminotransferase
VKSKAKRRGAGDVVRVSPESLARPLVRRLHAYVPGEQPKIAGLIKLNTNENPYPPAPAVIEAVQEAVDGRLRLYPNPNADALREKLARLHDCRVENIVVGNGSDELLALATRAFVDPTGDVRASGATARSRCTVQYFTPSYSLYPVLTDIHGAIHNAVSLTPDFQMPPLDLLKKSRAWDFKAALSIVTTPNAPSGRAYSTAELDALCRMHRGVIILDEAYVDFARENAMALALRHPHVLVARTFSKSYSLCFQRIGYFVGHPVLIEALMKVKDSYNVNGLGQVAAVATLENLPYYHANVRRVIATRDWTARQLEALGFSSQPSETNFLFARPPGFPARQWHQKLRDRNILVRWFDLPAVRDSLRISIGTASQMESLVKAVRAILRESK